MQKKHLPNSQNLDFVGVVILGRFDFNANVWKLELKSSEIKKEVWSFGEAQT